MLLRALDRFYRHEASGGIVLMISAVLALMVANSALSGDYHRILELPLAVLLNGEGIEKDLLHWINDGLMAIFFFLVGLELKREMMEGKLKNPSDVVLPGMAAVGGMVVPALVFVALNWGNVETIGGWAIPAATDIAFALGVLALLGDRAPPALKIFLLTLAILDDLGAILIIALFYTSDLKIDYLYLAAIPFAIMLWMNLKAVHRTAPILLLGVVLWALVLKSGVHATLAGVVTAFMIPLKDKWDKSPLHSIEHGLTLYVFYVIVPLFAFANAGVVLKGLSLADLVAPLTLGIAGGLVVGKLVGVFGTTFLLVNGGLARLPAGVNWLHILGVSALAGIGFTMSLFIGSLSYASNALMNEVRLGVLSGSAVAAVIGFTLLYLAGRDPKAEIAGEAEPEDEPGPEAVMAE